MSIPFDIHDWLEDNYTWLRQYVEYKRFMFGYSKASCEDRTHDCVVELLESPPDDEDGIGAVLHRVLDRHNKRRIREKKRRGKLPDEIV